MNFTDLVLEELNSVYKVLRRATDEEINNYLKLGYIHEGEVEGAWLMHIIEGTEDRNNIVFYIPKSGDRSYVLFMPNSYIFDGSVKEDSPVAQAIKHWELEQKLLHQGFNTNKAKDAASTITKI